MARKGFWVLGFFFLLLLFALVAFSAWLIGPELDLWAQPNRIAVVKISGVIAQSDHTVEELKRFREDPNVKAILVRIESPGGGVAPSQEIYREIRRTIADKPVVASMGGIAASGGYYIASAANHIVANPGTLTGSIGVIIHFPKLKKLFEKIGYQSIVIKSGRFKDSGDPGRDMTEEEKELLQGTIDKVHKQFIRDVAKGRHMPREDIEKIADGRILAGETALELGLVDEMGNLEDAVKKAAQLGRIAGQPELVYERERRESVLDWLLGKTAADQVSSQLADWAHPLRYQSMLVP